MAIQNTTLRGAEHDWFATRSGEPANAPLTQHKLAYFANKGFGNENFDIIYTADALPENSSPTWTKRDGTNATTEISPAGFLHMVSADDGITYDTGSNIDESIGATMEFRMKVLAGDAMDYPTLANDSTSVELQNNDGSPESTYFSIYTDGVLNQEDGTNYEFDTTDGYHVYRVTLSGTTGNLYVDGVLRLTQTTVSSGAGAGFGFWSGYEASGGVETSWDYVLCRSDGAYAPNSGRVQKTITQLEREWLQSVSGSTSNHMGDLWREAVAAQGLTPSVKQSENQFIFYTQVSSNP